jgi:hypothetical protein
MQTEIFCGQVDCKQRPVDLSALDASNAITSHTWTSSGDLIIGSAHGLLFLVHGAASASDDRHDPASQLHSLQAVPLFLSELSKWNAGAVVAVHASTTQLTLVMECPDGTAGLVLLFAADTANLYSTEAHSVRHVEVPASRALAGPLSPDGQQLAIVDDTSRVVLVPTALDGEHHTARVASFGLAGLGSILSIARVNGTHGSGVALFLALQDSGMLHMYMMEDSVRVSNDMIAPRVTLLRSARLGQPGAAMDAHPSLPIVAVATTSGVVQLVHAEEFQSSTMPDAGNTAALSSIVQFTAYCLNPGTDKALKWSPDGASLAAIDCVSGIISFLCKKSHPHRTGHHTLSVLGSYRVTGANMICWHQPESCTEYLIVHQSNGHLMVLDVPQAAAAAKDGFFAPGSLQHSRLRLATPLVDMHSLQQLSSSSQILVLGVTWDCSIRRFRISTEPSRAASSKKAASTFAAAAPVDAETLQVLCHKHCSPIHVAYSVFLPFTSLSNMPTAKKVYESK